MANSFKFTAPSFGAATTQATTAFGFPQPTATAANAFSFGTSQKTVAPVLGFGSTPQTSVAPAFGFGGAPSFSFGATSTAQPTNAFSFTSSAPTGPFSFTPQTSMATTNTGSLFGGLGGGMSQFSIGGLGTSQATGAPAFNIGGLNSFGTTSTQSTTFLGGLTYGAGLGNQPIGANNFMGVPQNTDNVWNSVSMPMIYGDEKDAILAKWNTLQAFWGHGKAYFAPKTPPVLLDQRNRFCVFKAVGYSYLPTGKPEDGLVMLTIGKKETEVRNQQQQLVDSLHRLLGSRPTISVIVEGVKSLLEDKTEVTFYLLERAPNGLSRRIPTNEVCAFLETPNIKSQLATLSVSAVVSRVAFTKEQLKAYLDNPPAGIDPLLWQQAKQENPNPDKLIPVPIIGFQEIYQRLKGQEQETKQHENRLDIIAEDLSELQRWHTTTGARIDEHKRKQLELAHRVLKVMVNQEIRRKMGYSIQAEEENLKVHLENIQLELNAPTQFKGHLNELLSQIRLQNHQQALVTGTSEERYSVDNDLKEFIKQHLKCEQEGISHLINILKEDMEDLKIIEVGLKDLLESRRQ